MKTLNRVVLPSVRALVIRTPSGDLDSPYARISKRRGERITLDRPLMGDVEWEMGDLQVMSEALSDFSDDELHQAMAEADAKLNIDT